MPPVSFQGFELTLAEINALQAKLTAAGWQFSAVPYAHWRATQGKVNITAYQSGKTTFQGAGCDAVASVLLPGKSPAPPKKSAGVAAPAIIQGRTETALETALRTTPQMFEPHAGIDESGKGDYFGPLVIACAYTDAESTAKLLDAGVRDSKLLSSDKEALKLEATIQAVLQGRYAVICIGVEKLNDLYDQIGNLNELLIWGHAKALEELLGKVPDCPRAISDQFGQGNLVHRKLQERGRRIILDEHPKAEADIAVAAASILARAVYVKEISRLSAQAGLALPKGCSDKVLSCAKEFLKLHPKNELRKFAKIFFKTTEKLE